jgi:hypothetical protein
MPAQTPPSTIWRSCSVLGRTTATAVWSSTRRRVRQWGLDRGHGVRVGLDLVHRHLDDDLRREIRSAVASSAAIRLSLIYQDLFVLSRTGRLTPAHELAVRHEFDTLRRDSENRS